MEIKKDEKYWKDYTKFINEVENLTKVSPAALLSHYKMLVELLNDADEKCPFEWEFELAYETWIRHDIQKVIDHKPLLENVLFKYFKVQIEILDSEFKKHILNFDQADWWHYPRLKFDMD